MGSLILGLTKQDPLPFHPSTSTSFPSVTYLNPLSFIQPPGPLPLHPPTLTVFPITHQPYVVAKTLRRITRTRGLQIMGSFILGLTKPDPLPFIHLPWPPSLSSTEVNPIPSSTYLDPLPFHPPKSTPFLHPPTSTPFSFIHLPQLNSPLSTYLDNKDNWELAEFLFSFWCYSTLKSFSSISTSTLYF